jgi:hypothetical protein
MPMCKHVLAGRYLSPFQGDFTKRIVADIWTERGPNGDWQVPGAEKIRRKEANSNWHKWLHKYVSFFKVTPESCFVMLCWDHLPRDNLQTCCNLHD